MFGAVAEPQKLNGHVGDLEADSRVYLPRPESKEEEGDRHPYRVTVPRNSNFFHKYPRKWTWDSWAKRVEFEWIMMARALDAVIWATIGALLGLAFFAIPGAFISGYNYVIWQPLGAALGAALGGIGVWRRWRPIFQSHNDLL